MNDTGLGPEAILHTRASGPIHAPYAAIRGSEPDNMWGNLGESGGYEVGCAVVCADHRKGDAADEKGVGNGVYLKGRIVGDEQMSTEC